jgi:hypothetical protein
MGSETIQFVTSLVSAIDDEARRCIERQLRAEPEREISRHGVLEQLVTETALQKRRESHLTQSTH